MSVTNMELQCNLAIAKYKLFNKKDKLLLACSGGKDSVALFHCLLTAGYSFSVAHVNYRLREAASADEKFVRNLAKKHNIASYTHHVDEHEVPVRNVQEWAREVRYKFFREIIAQSRTDSPETSFRYIVIAHSLDDYVESLLMNIGKGRNLWQDPGISIKTELYRRPLLLCSSDEIYEFLHTYNYVYQVDSTNVSDKYERNRIRHKLLPHIRAQFPDMDNGLRKFIHNNYLKAQARNYAFSELSSELIILKDGYQCIKLPKDIDEELVVAFLFEKLQPLGFHPDRIEQIISSSTGSIFSSETHEILKNRDEIHLRKREDKKVYQQKEIRIEKTDILAAKKHRLGNYLLIVEQVESFIAGEDGHTEIIQLSESQFPLTIRKWQPGDAFQPLGMVGIKKVKKFLTDIELSRWEKEETYVLLNARGEIIWIIPYRISEKVKFQENSARQLYKVSFVKY